MTKATVEDLLRLPPEKRLEIADLLLRSIEPQEGPPPAYLYKYLRFCEGLEDLFAHSRIKFTAPSDFNDLLDCMIEPLWETSEQQALGQEALQRVQRTLGVLPLTEEPLSVTMWARYGDNYRGLCIRFATEGNDYFGRAQRVRYRQDYPAFSGLSTPMAQQYDNILLTKSLEWRDEREWRLITHTAGNHELPREALVAVIFGLRTPDAQKEQVRG